MASIDEFKGNMQQGGARPNQFKVFLTFPSIISRAPGAAYAGQFLCKATELPASTIEAIGIHYRGRKINFAGERSFAPWSISIYNDENFVIRTAMEEWQSYMQNYTFTNGEVRPAAYKVQMQVVQLGRNGEELKEYQFSGAFPTVVGKIALSFENNAEIETFDVEFQYDYFEVSVAGVMDQQGAWE